MVSKNRLLFVIKQIIIKRFYVLFFIVLFTSCDPYHEAYLCNESQKDIEILIKIDEQHVIDIHNKNYSARFLKEFSKEAGNLEEVEIDTVSLIGHYKIKTDKCALMDEGITISPEYIFNYLAVITISDTLILSNRKEIENAFKRIKGSRYELTVK